MAEYLNNKELEQNIASFQNSKRNKAKYELIIGDLRGAHDRKQKRSKNNRVPDELKEKITIYDDISREHEESRAKLADNFLKLSGELVRYAKFSLIDADDAVQEGVMICFEKIDRFDPEKGKAFNYMTTCIYNHFRQLYRTAKNYSELKRKYNEFINFQVNHTVIKNGKEIVYFNNG